MPLLAEYAITPDVFDIASYSSEEVCGLHIQILKEVLLNEGLVRDLRVGEWGRHFQVSQRTWHIRGRELLKKLGIQKRLVQTVAALPNAPTSDADWCSEALASHANLPLGGIVASDAVAKPHALNGIVSSVAKLSSSTWWQSRSPSLRLSRSFQDYVAALKLILQHANSLMLIDPYIDPTDKYQYTDLMRLLGTLQNRTQKPYVELHRAAWQSGQDKSPCVDEIVEALTPGLTTVAKTAGISFEVFLWDDIHDRYLITDLIGISLPHGFGTTTNPQAATIWSRLGREDRDAIQRDFDPARRKPRHRFCVS